MLGASVLAVLHPPSEEINRVMAPRSSPWVAGEYIETPKGKLKIVDSFYIRGLDEWIYTFRIERPRRIPSFTEVEYKESRLEDWHQFLQEDEWDILSMWSGCLGGLTKEMIYAGNTFLQ